jgi:hypothetical protein
MLACGAWRGGGEAGMGGVEEAEVVEFGRKAAHVAGVLVVR